MTLPSYVSVENQDHDVSGSPRLPSTPTPDGTRAYGSPSPSLGLSPSNRSNLYGPPSPSLGLSPSPRVFSSAQSYAAVSTDQGDGVLRSPSSRPFLVSSQSSYNSRPMSQSSSRMFGGTDYDSVHQLARYDGKDSIPMQGYYDKEDDSMMSPTPTPGDDHDYRAAGLAKYGVCADQAKKQKWSPKKKWTIFAIVVALLVIIAIAVAIPLLTIEKNNRSSGSNSGSSGNVLTAGGNGTVIKLANGTEFTYINSGYFIIVTPSLASSDIFFFLSLRLQRTVEKWID